MTISITDSASAEAAINACREKIIAGKADANTQSKEFSTHKRAELYGMLGEAYSVALELSKESNTKVRVAMLAKFKIPATPRKGNKFGPLVRLLFGKKDKTGILKLDDSSWKYANTFRYARDNKWPADKFAERLEAFKDPVSKKAKLQGTELADRAAYKVTDPNVATAQKNYDCAMLLDPFCVIERADEIIPEDRQRDGAQVCVWGVYKKGRFEARGYMPVSELALKKVVEKYAAAEAAKFKEEVTDPLFVELAQHNAEVNAANEAHYAAKAA